MAIFGRNDSDLPLLTQFYQLDPPPHGWEYDTPSLEGTEMQTWLRQHEDFSLSKEPTETFYSLVKLHPLAYSIMNTVCSNQTVEAGALFDLSLLMRSMSDYFIGDEPAIVSGYLPEEYISIRQLQWKTVREGLYSNLLGDLHAVVMGQKDLCRCPECLSPFLVTRKGLTFCSVRCGDRSRARRARQKRALETGHANILEKDILAVI